MALIKITIETGNAAFQDIGGRKGPTEATAREVARIMRVMAYEFERHGSMPAPRDINYDVVGKVEVID